jgi:hypothetical protein
MDASSGSARLIVSCPENKDRVFHRTLCARNAVKLLFRKPNRSDVDNTGINNDLKPVPFHLASKKEAEEISPPQQWRAEVIDSSPIRKELTGIDGLLIPEKTGLLTDPLTRIRP